MKARAIKHPGRAEARENRRAILHVLLGFGAVAIVFGTLLLKPPLDGVIQVMAASITRGDKIEMTTSVAPNPTAPTKPAAGLIGSSSNSVAVTMTNAASTALVESFKTVTVDGEKYRALSFGQLSSFRFKMPEGPGGSDANATVAIAWVLAQIPAEVKAFNEKAVVLTGFMLPIKWNETLVTDFMLLPNQMGCCYGVMPRINDVVVVHTTGRGVKAQQDTPVSVLGTFHVGALRNNDALIGIYQMDCDRVVEPKTLNPP